MATVEEMFEEAKAMFVEDQPGVPAENKWGTFQAFLGYFPN